MKPQQGTCALRTRRSAIASAVAALLYPLASRGQVGAPAGSDRWYQAALEMRRQAQSWGDQAYGAVLVKDGRIIGHGPSRVVRNNDPDAHAEREAIKDARARLGAEAIRGAILYSTSRPCSACEQAAAKAAIARMYFGPELVDAGVPRALE